MRTLVDSTVDAIIVHEPGGRLIFFNEAARVLLALDDEQMAALPPFGWVASEYKLGAPARLESILHDERKKFMSAIVRADGTIVPTEVTASRIDSTDGPLIVAVIRDVRERAEIAEHLEHLAYHDALTGVANRNAFEERLAIAIADAVRYGDLLVLAYVDLDHFKPVNDRYGHEAGDLVLIEMARRLTKSVRRQDLVARLGGDEFVVLQQRVESIDEVAAIADRLIKAVRRPVSIKPGAMVQVDASVGFSVFDKAIDDARTLLVKADVAMYEAKRDPARAWLVWEPGMGGVDGAPAAGRGSGAR